MLLPRGSLISLEAAARSPDDMNERNAGLPGETCGVFITGARSRSRTAIVGVRSQLGGCVTGCLQIPTPLLQNTGARDIYMPTRVHIGTAISELLCTSLGDVSLPRGGRAGL